MTLTSMTPAGEPLSILSLPAAGRARGMLVFGAPGVGKSRLIGRRLAFGDLIHERPHVIIDPIGGTIDNFLDKLLFIQTFLTPAQRKTLWERIVYVDMGSGVSICPFPLYYRLGTERSLREVADRYLDLILKSNPWLLTAQVLGWPPLHDIGLHTGMVLAALDLQITSAQELLRRPEQWEKAGKFAEAEKRNPEAAAVAYFR
jgi:hypothetical protein